MNYIFFYGTLKKNQPNHFFITDPKNGYFEFVGNAITVDKWPLVIAGIYNLPFLLDNRNNGNRVHGELYKIDNKALEFVDVLERNKILYERKYIKVQLINDEKQILYAWTYILTNYNENLNALKTLENYDNNNENMKKYVPREERKKELIIQEYKKNIN